MDTNTVSFTIKCQTFTYYIPRRPRKMPKPETRIWYPAERKGGGLTVVLPDAEAHILYHGIFMCRKPINDVLREVGAVMGVLRQGVIPGNPMCQKCQDAYKANPNFAYWKWIKLTKGA
jgi:hypothetical protein